jgi:hypothetical protein
LLSLIIMLPVYRILLIWSVFLRVENPQPKRTNYPTKYDTKKKRVHLRTDILIAVSDHRAPCLSNTNHLCFCKRKFHNQQERANQHTDQPITTPHHSC